MSRNWEDWAASVGAPFGQPAPDDPALLPLKRERDGGLQWALPVALRAAGNAAAQVLNPLGGVVSQAPGMIGALGDAVMLPGDVLLGRVPDRQTLLDRTANMAWTLAGTGRGLPAPEGSLGVFAGRRAATADTELLSRAMNTGAKASPEATWNRTGWFQDVDGKWKFEISDTDAKLKPEGYRPANTPGGTIHGHVSPITGNTVGVLLDHPALFRAYPWLRALPVEAENEGALGTHYPPRRSNDLGKIGLAPQHPESLLSTLLHETQHAIQTHEGFATGGSPSEWLPPKFRQLVESHEGDSRDAQDRLAKALHGPGPLRGGANLADAQMNAVQTKLGIWGMLRGMQPTPGQMDVIARAQMLHPEEYNRLQDSLQSLHGLYSMQDEAHANYSRLAGEVEARNVEERRAGGHSEPTLAPSLIDGKMKLHRTAPTPPWLTPGYTPRGDQIVRFGQNERRAVSPRSDSEFIAGLPDWLAREHYHLEPVESDPFSETL